MTNVVCHYIDEPGIITRVCFGPLLIVLVCLVNSDQLFSLIPKFGYKFNSDYDRVC